MIRDGVPMEFLQNLAFLTPMGFLNFLANLVQPYIHQYKGYCRLYLDACLILITSFMSLLHKSAQFENNEFSDRKTKISLSFKLKLFKSCS